MQKRFTKGSLNFVPIQSRGNLFVAKEGVRKERQSEDGWVGGWVGLTGDDTEQRFEKFEIRSRYALKAPCRTTVRL